MEEVRIALRNHSRARTSGFYDLSVTADVQELHALTTGPPEVMERRIGRDYLIERSWLMGLVLTVFALTVLAMLPALLMTTIAIGTISSLLFGNMLLVGICIPVMYGRVFAHVRAGPPPVRTYLFMARGLDKMLLGVALVAGLLSGYAVASTALGLARCNDFFASATHDPVVILDDRTNTTGWKQLGRHIGLFSEFANIQACQDDYVVTIGFAVLCGVLVVLDGTMAILFGQIESKTAAMYARVYTEAQLKKKTIT